MSSPDLRIESRAPIRAREFEGDWKVIHKELQQDGTIKLVFCDADGRRLVLTLAEHVLAEISAAPPVSAQSARVSEERLVDRLAGA